MTGQNYYLVTSLPTLGKLGSEPPMTGRNLLEHVEASATARAAIEAILLGGDLIQREAILSGELSEPAPVILTEAQLRDEQPLPACLAPSGGTEIRRGAAADAIWEAYFRHAASVAEQIHNAFLGEWIACEVALRNALISRRAKALELDPNDYLVAADLGEDADFSLLVSEWSAAPDPLTALQLLDKSRWDWVTQHDRWFTFADDELAAYAVKLTLLERWHNLAAAGKQKQEQPPAVEKA